MGSYRVRYLLLRFRHLSSVGMAHKMKGIKLDILDQDGPHSDIWYSAHTRVVNIHHGMPEGAIYIGRPGKGHDGYFGNPFPVNKYDLRSEVLNTYQAYLDKRIKLDPIFRARVKLLSGKTLACFCVPKLCHGMVLAEVADNLNE